LISIDLTMRKALEILAWDTDASSLMKLDWFRMRYFIRAVLKPVWTLSGKGPGFSSASGL